MIQIQTEHEVVKNQEKILNYIEQIANSADILIFPENSMSLAAGKHKEIAQSLDDEFVRSIAAASAKTDTMVIFGMLEKETQMFIIPLS